MKLNDLDNFDPKQVDLEQYEVFKDTLESHQGDIPPSVAFQLAVWANRLIDYYTTYYVKAKGFLEDQETDYEALFHTKSEEYNPDKVADGERKAKKDTDIVAKKKFLSKVRRYVNYLELTIDNLTRHHYLLKQRHAEGEKEAKRSDY